jgi:hypothetical protein
MRFFCKVRHTSVSQTSSKKETASMIRSSLLARWALGLMVLLAGSASVPAVDIFVLSNNTNPFNSASTDFGRIDSATGNYSSIASLSGDVWNLSWNQAAGNFYVTQGSGSGATLRTLSTTGTISASLGTIGKSIFGMAYRTADSTIYGFDYVNDDTGTISTSNGAWTVLNASPGIGSNAPIGGRYSIMNDTIYMANALFGNGTFGTMGYTSSSTYQSIVNNILYSNMALANDGTTMYGIFGDGTAGNQKLYTINVATGALTAGPSITGTGLGTYFHGAGIVPVPEPSTYALAAIATGVMAAIARRSKARRA